MVKKKALVDGLAHHFPYAAASCKNHLANAFTNATIAAAAETANFMQNRTYLHNMCNKLVGAIPRLPMPPEPEITSKKLMRLRKHLMQNQALSSMATPTTPTSVSSLYNSSGYANGNGNRNPVMNTVNYAQFQNGGNYNRNLNYNNNQQYCRYNSTMPTQAYNLMTPTAQTKTMQQKIRPQVAKQHQQHQQQQQQQPRSEQYRLFNFGTLANNYIRFQFEDSNSIISNTSNSNQNETSTTDFNPVSILKKRTTTKAEVDARVMQDLQHFKQSTYMERNSNHHAAANESTACANNLDKVFSSFKPPVIHSIKTSPKLSEAKINMRLNENFTHTARDFTGTPSRQCKTNEILADKNYLQYKPSQKLNAKCSNTKFVACCDYSEDEEEQVPRRNAEPKRNNRARYFTRNNDDRKPATNATPGRKTTESPSMATSKRVNAGDDGDAKVPSTKNQSKPQRKLNLSQMFKANKLQDLKTNQLWESLMQLVVHMFANDNDLKLDNLNDRIKTSNRNRSKSTEKRYAIYLVVTSDDETDDENAAAKGDAPAAMDERVYLTKQQNQPAATAHVEANENAQMYEYRAKDSKEDFETAFGQRYQKEHMGMPEPQQTQRPHIRSRSGSRTREHETEVVLIPTKLTSRISSRTQSRTSSPQLLSSLPNTQKSRAPLHRPKMDYSKSQTSTKCDGINMRSHSRSKSRTKRKSEARNMAIDMDSLRLCYDYPLQYTNGKRGRQRSVYSRR